MAPPVPWSSEALKKRICEEDCLSKNWQTPHFFVSHPRGGTWIQNDGGVHAYDGFCEPALEKIAKNDTRH